MCDAYEGNRWKRQAKSSYQINRTNEAATHRANGTKIRQETVCMGYTTKRYVREHCNMKSFSTVDSSSNLTIEANERTYTLNPFPPRNNHSKDSLCFRILLTQKKTTIKQTNSLGYTFAWISVHFIHQLHVARKKKLFFFWSKAVQMVYGHRKSVHLTNTELWTQQK